MFKKSRSIRIALIPKNATAEYNIVNIIQISRNCLYVFTPEKSRKPIIMLNTEGANAENTPSNSPISSVC